MMESLFIIILFLIFILPAFGGQEEDEILTPAPADRTPARTFSQLERRLQEIDEAGGIRPIPEGQVRQAFAGILPPHLRDENLAPPDIANLEGAAVTAVRSEFEYTEFENAELADEVRFQKQCFLAYNIQHIRNIVRLGTNYDDRVDSSIPKHVLSVNADPALLTSRFVSKENIEKLFDLKPYQLSLLVPQVRIFKIIYPDIQSARRGVGGRQIEFGFDSSLSAEKLTQITQSRRGRGGGVGIKSFNWEFLGVNPAEVENNIKANLKLHFNDINEFHQERDQPAYEVQGQIDRGGKYRFSELVLPEPIEQLEINSPDTRIYNPRYFRIKIIVGWAVPSNQRSLFPNFDEIQRVLQTNQKIMFLTLLKHNLNFNQDGSMELDAEYQAYVEGVFTSRDSDILRIRTGEVVTEGGPRRVEEVEDSIRRLNAYQNGGTIEPCGDEPVREDSGFIFQTEAGTDVELQRGISSEADFEWVEEQLEEEREARILEQLFYQRINKATAYSNLLKQLRHGKIYRILVDPAPSLGFESSISGESEVPENIEPVGEPPEDAATQHINAEYLRRSLGARRFLSSTVLEITNDMTAHTPVANGGGSAFLNIDRLVRQGRTPSSSRANSGRSLLPHGRNNAQDWNEDDFQEGIEEMQRYVQWRTIEDYYDRRVVPIEFMFFGDLIDAVLAPFSDRAGNFQESAGTYYDRERIKILLGSFYYQNPADLDGNRELIPLAEIPISVELFGMWFLEEIVEPMRQRYTFRQFIRSVFNTLLLSAFTQCLYDPGGEHSMVQENLALGVEIYDIPTNRMGRLRHNGKIYLRDVPSRLTEVGINQSLALTEEDYHHVVLYNPIIADPDFIVNNDDRDFGSVPYQEILQNDFRDGIYHLNLGSDRGLVKTIQFSRMDQNYNREARMERAGSLGEGTFGQIRERYNATVTLYGSSLFYPGQYIYINPSMMGLQTVMDKETLSAKLGLGGYFLIVKVENIIEEGLYESILDCRWTHSGFKVETGRRGASCGTTIYGLDDRAMLEHFNINHAEATFGYNNLFADPSIFASTDDEIIQHVYDYNAELTDGLFLTDIHGRPANIIFYAPNDPESWQRASEGQEIYTEGWETDIIDTPDDWDSIRIQQQQNEFQQIAEGTAAFESVTTWEQIDQIAERYDITPEELGFTDWPGVYNTPGVWATIQAEINAKEAAIQAGTWSAGEPWPPE